MWIKILSIVSSYATLVGLAYSIKPSDQPFTTTQAILIGIAIILCVITLAYEIYGYFHNNRTFYKSESGIKQYLYDWITRGGRVAIFTRDMSWVDSQKMENLLLQKSRSGELYICLPEEIDLTRRLRDAGARFFTYSELNYIPKSRFTIINKDRMDAQLAVGRSKENKILVEEFAEGDHPAFNIANDLFEVIVKLGERNRAN